MVQNSIYRVNSGVFNETPVAISTTKALGTQWFQNNTSTSLMCGACIPTPALSVTDITDLDEFTAEEGFGQANTAAQTSQWESGRYLFERLAQNPSLLGQSKAVNAFYKKNQKQHLAQFNKADEAVNTINTTDEGTNTQIEELLFRIDDVNAEATAEYAKFKNAVTFKDSLAIYEAAENIELSATPHHLALNNLLKEIAAAQIEKANAAIPIIAALNTKGLAEANRKTILNIYAQSMTVDNQVISQEDRGIVANIAHQCVEEGGSAVIMARAIYQSFANSSFDDTLLCEPSIINDITKSIKNQRNDSANSLDIVPNPSLYETVLLVNIAQKEPFELFVTDMMGNIVKKVEDTNSNAYTLNTSDLASGIYFCRLLTKSGISISQKLIIQK